MRAMVFNGSTARLRLDQPEIPSPGPDQVRVRVLCCGVCRTDLHIVDGDLTEPALPLVPGHEIVGFVDALGSAVTKLSIGQRIGVPWLGWSCAACRYCLSGRENLCDLARFTGYTLDGGYADYALADWRYCFDIPSDYGDQEVAPLLCAGLIGYRALKMAGDARRIGIYGFGAAAHIIAQVARHQGREIYAFTRPADQAAQDFAMSLGADWAGDSDTLAPHPLDAALLFAPVGALVPKALRAVVKGGVVVCAGIHMSEIPAFPYDILWGERMLRSVANLTTGDAREFLAIAGEFPIRTRVSVYPLEQANEALDDLRAGRLQGAAVLAITGAQN